MELNEKINFSSLQRGGKVELIFGQKTGASAVKILSPSLKGGILTEFSIKENQFHLPSGQGKSGIDFRLKSLMQTLEDSVVRQNPFPSPKGWIYLPSKSFPQP